MSIESIQSPKSKPSGQYGSAMKGADVLVSALEREGVEVVFAYPGGADELHQSSPDPVKSGQFCQDRSKERVYGSRIR